MGVRCAGAGACSPYGGVARGLESPAAGLVHSHFSPAPSLPPACSLPHGLSRVDVPEDLVLRHHIQPSVPGPGRDGSHHVAVSCLPGVV